MADEVRMIDANVLIKCLTEWYDSAYPHDKEIIEMAILDVNNTPTIEPEPDNGWISVEDRLPKEYDSVLLVAEVTNSFIFSKTDRVITIGRLKPSGKWQTIGVEYLDMEITHWRTLPALPKGE